MNVMVEELGSIETREGRRIQLENEALDILLFEFLQSLIYFKDSERLLLHLGCLKLPNRTAVYLSMLPLAVSPWTLGAISFAPMLKR